MRIPLGSSVVQHAPQSAVLVSLAFVHGALLLTFPFLPVFAFGIWWNSNTVAHYFLHSPFFSRRWLNVLFALYLSVLLGIPQSLWRDRHLAHHAGTLPRMQFSGKLVVELTLIITLWGSLLILAPWFFLTAYLPGYALGLILCGIHGHFEHIEEEAVSHYGRLYNWLFLNDGYHIEHHTNPDAPWSELPTKFRTNGKSSYWPAILRWLDLFDLESLERFVLRVPALQRFVLDRHEFALRALGIQHLPVQRVAIVGGGLFPRSALLLQRLLPNAQLSIIDARASHLDIARRFLLDDQIELINDWYQPRQHSKFDLLIVPLAYVGAREELYRCPPTTYLLMHDWLWRRRGTSRIVSLLLLKRLNLVRR